MSGAEAGARPGPLGRATTTVGPGETPACRAEALGVRQALGLVGGVVASHLPGDMWVMGEVVSVTRSKAGHLYLTLAEESARLSCAALGRDALRISGVLRAAGVELAEGVSLRLRGRLQVYAERGSVELLAVDVDPRVAVGNHQLIRLAARESLVRGGLLGRQAALVLAGPPLCLGVVAPEGAGLGDLQAILGASPWAWDLRVVRTPAEGPTAPGRIAAGLALAASGTDLVVLARGGGAAVGLPYDTEAVATAVASCPVPVVSALGHSSDRTLADEVAWRSVATPSAAAGLVCDLVVSAEGQILELGRQIAAGARGQLDRATRRLERLEVDVDHQLALRRQRVSVPVRPPPPAPVEVGEDHWRRTALVAALVAVVAVVALIVVLGYSRDVGRTSRCLGRDTRSAGGRQGPGASAGGRVGPEGRAASKRSSGGLAPGRRGSEPDGRCQLGVEVLTLQGRPGGCHTPALVCDHVGAWDTR